MLLALLVLTGCAVSRAGAPIPSRTAPSSTPASTPAETATSTSAERPTEPTEPELPQVVAADGVDTGACLDGSCEVAIAGPVTIQLPTGALVISAASPDGVDFDLTTGSGSGSGNLRGFCLLTFYPGGLSSSCPVDAPGPPPAPAPGRVFMQLGGVTADGAPVLRVIAG